VIFITCQDNVGVSGVELQDHEFFVSIHGNRKPNANVKRVQPYYGVLDKLERELAQGRRARATRPPRSACARRFA
jgi:hypothetical protein